MLSIAMLMRRRGNSAIEFFQTICTFLHNRSVKILTHVMKPSIFQKKLCWNLNAFDGDQMKELNFVFRKRVSCSINENQYLLCLLTFRQCGGHRTICRSRNFICRIEVVFSDIEKIRTVKKLIQKNWQRSNHLLTYISNFSNRCIKFNLSSAFKENGFSFLFLKLFKKKLLHRKTENFYIKQSTYEKKSKETLVFAIKNKIVLISIK